MTEVLSVPKANEDHIANDTLSLEHAIQQLINLGDKDPLVIARKIDERYETNWLRDELYALREDVISDIARRRINGLRRSAMMALRKGKPATELLLLGEWVPDHKGGGGWKKLADWTEFDLRSRENYYRKMSATSIRLADWCHECIELMRAEGAKKLGRIKAPLPALSVIEKDAIENGKPVEE